MQMRFTIFSLNLPFTGYLIFVISMFLESFERIKNRIYLWIMTSIWKIFTSLPEFFETRTISFNVSCGYLQEVHLFLPSFLHLHFECFNCLHKRLSSGIDIHFGFHLVSIICHPNKAGDGRTKVTFSNNNNFHHSLANEVHLKDSNEQPAQKLQWIFHLTGLTLIMLIKLHSQEVVPRKMLLFWVKDLHYTR